MPSSAATGPKDLEGSNLKCEKRAPPKNAFACPENREEGEGSSAANNSDEEVPTTGRAGILQRRGRARVREMTENTRGQASECLAAEIRGSPDAGSVCHVHARVLHLERVVTGQRCGAGQTSCAIHEPTNL